MTILPTRDWYRSGKPSADTATPPFLLVIGVDDFTVAGLGRRPGVSVFLDRGVLREARVGVSGSSSLSSSTSFSSDSASLSSELDLEQRCDTQSIQGLPVPTASIDDGLFKLLGVRQRKTVESFTFLEVTLSLENQLRSLQAPLVTIIKH